MQTNTKTRTQRRLEKRQTIILLALLLLVSLVSFVLGVTTGRRGAERDLAGQLVEQQETVRIVQVPAATPELPPVSPPAAEAVTPPDRDDRLIDAVVESARLTFFDDLVRDSSPLGSGINQPPSAPEARQSGAQPPLDLADRPIVVRDAETGAVALATPQTSRQVAPPAPASIVELPTVVPQGTHVVQVGSFGSAADAASLRQTMIDKGYPAFLAEADLGERGIWYRVRVGPYADANAAGIARQIIHDKEKIEGLVTRHTP